MPEDKGYKAVIESWSLKYSATTCIELQDEKIGRKRQLVMQ